MVGRVITSNSVMQSITVVPPEDVMVVPQFGKARFGASSYDAEQVNAWVGEALSKNAKLRREVTELRLQLSTQGVQNASMRQSSEGVVASKDLEISRKDDEIKSLNDKIANLKADLVKEKSRNSLTGVADELDALRNKTQALCDKRIAEATAKPRVLRPTRMSTRRPSVLLLMNTLPALRLRLTNIARTPMLMQIIMLRR